ncbi:MAG: gamma-glutamyl-gamma-aminobutyrate hydrolase family protein [Chloroflexota bacterium]|nr:MAG: gamma-glutamyl-gamma-aminobutyrate hydrolase family protein [Chloroflexota bacterium]
MIPPIIGITTSRIPHYKEGFPTIAILEAYVQSVAQAGGAPLLIPLGLPEDQLSALLSRLDAVLFTGGGDIQTGRFQGEEHPLVAGVDADRDRVEFLLFDEVFKAKMPFFGICRGIQVANVAAGGSLYTHISDQHPQALRHNYHLDYPRAHLAHTVEVSDGTRIREILGQKIVNVNSLHHQGIARLAEGAVPVAFAPDGLVEAIEFPEHPFGVAVQWHPEWLQDQQPMRNLFRALVEAARGASNG